MKRFLAKVISLAYLHKGSKYRNMKRVLILSKMLECNLRRRAKSVGKRIILRGDNKVTRRTTIGEECVLNGVKIYGSGDITIGNHVIIAEGTVIQSQNHDYDVGNALPYGDGWTLKPVKVDDCVWIGMNVMLLPGTHICEGAVIQAGSVVHGEIPPLAIAGGNPAKVFARRDSEHYAVLRSQNSYRMW